MTEVFCDDLRVTVPLDFWPDVSGPLAAVLADVGMAPEFRDDKREQWRVQGGTVRTETYRVVRSVSASGQALARMRAMGLLGGFLATLGAVPCKVTGLHATLDREEPTPEVLERLMVKAASPEGLRAGRKRIPLGDLQRYLVRLPDGTDTGSIYCGPKTNEIRPVVYDKREERMAKGLPDPGVDITRYELRLRDVGATLRDAFDPTAIFWKYMAPDFLPAPENVPEWVPHGEGYALDKPVPLSPAERLSRRFMDSLDVADLVKIAASFPGGMDYLCDLIRRRAGSSTLQ